jgi:hypothetical protein
VLKVLANWIALDITRLGEEALPVKCDAKNNAWLAQSKVEFMLRQGDVHKRGVGAVQDCRNLTTTANSAGCTLTKFCTGGSGYVDVSHEISLCLTCI